MVVGVKVMMGCCSCEFGALQECGGAAAALLFPPLSREC